MSVGWGLGAEVAPRNTGKIFSLKEGAEVMREEPWNLLGMESLPLSIPPSWGGGIPSVQPGLGSGELQCALLL